MNWNKWGRQTHRWLAIVFTVLVIVNIVVNFVLVGQEALALWVGLLTLLPLAFLMFTGLYLFVLPYVTKRRNGQRPD
jgi:membrane protein implicated in regulation of membrane protease activity